MQRLPVITLTVTLAFCGTQLTAADKTDQGPVRVAPRPQARQEVQHLGERLPDVHATDLAGKRVSLLQLQGALVVVTRDVNCPLCKRYGPRLGKLTRKYAASGQNKKPVTFLFLNVNESDTPKMMHDEQKAFGFDGIYVHDPKRKVAAVLGVRTTTEAFVIDSAGTLRYRGAVDDQYGIGYSKQAPSRNYLIDAIDEVLQGRPVSTPATTSPGCVIELDSPDWQPSGKITYHNRISRIVQASCQSCHRKGGVGPFPLEAYRQVKARKSMIKYVLEEQIMPPWFAAEGTGPWLNDRRLSDRDRSALLSWIDDKCPEGSAKDAPATVTRDEGWHIGKPDLVIEIPETQSIPAEGFVDYRYMYVRTPNKEDRWIQSMEIRSTAPEVVHHVLVFQEEPRQPGESRRAFRRRFAGGLHGYFAGMVPGHGWTIYPDHVGKKLPANASLKFQVHYTPNGKAAKDRTAIGFKFRDTPPQYEITTASAATTRFRIPPGNPAYEVKAHFAFSEDATVYSFAPHMHLRGKAFRYELARPDGVRQLLLDVPRYDFNWQLRYKLAEPIDIPAGSVIHATAWFDNSADNPANPDPNQTVRFGEQTFDEMMIGYFEWYARPQAQRGSF
ncbi:MAG: redoxin domain-containing protein [Planctomycetota bacterium]